MPDPLQIIYESISTAQQELVQSIDTPKSDRQLIKFFKDYGTLSSGLKLGKHTLLLPNKYYVLEMDIIEVFSYSLLPTVTLNWIKQIAKKYGIHWHKIYLYAVTSQHLSYIILGELNGLPIAFQRRSSGMPWQKFYNPEEHTGPYITHGMKDWVANTIEISIKKKRRDIMNPETPDSLNFHDL